MTNRVPLIVNSSTGQIQELAAGDNLSLTSSDIVGVGNVTAVGNVTGTYFLGNGALLTGISVGSAGQISNGTSNVNVVSSGGNVTVGVGGTSNVAVFGTNTITVRANILPAANVTYDLGSPTQRFNDLYLAGNTIDLGGATISANATALTITNPQGGTFVSQGTGTEAISVTGNIVTTGGIFIGNGAGLTGVVASSNVG